MGDRTEEEMVKHLEECGPKMVNMLRFIIDKQCEEDDLPKNVMPSLIMHLLEDYFAESVEHLVKKGRLDTAQTYIGLTMRNVQDFVQLADKARKDIEGFQKQEKEA